MTDDTPADKGLNLGACFVDGTGAITSEVPEFTGAYRDPARGALKVTDVKKEDYPSILSFLEDGNYRIYDYMFFYRNLEKNVQTRIDQYLAFNNIKAGGFYQNKLARINDALPGNWGYLRTMGTGEGEALGDFGAVPSGGEALDDLGPVFLAGTVTNEMCTPDYWLNKRTNPDQIIMDDGGIAAFNEEQLPKHPDHHSYYYYVGENRARQLSGDKLTELLEVFSFSPEREWYYVDGTLVDDEFYDELNHLRNIESVEPVNEIRYGVALKSTGIRIGPSDIPISAGLYPAGE